MKKAKAKDIQEEQFDWPDVFHGTIGIKLPESQPKEGLRFTVFIKDMKSFNINQYPDFCSSLFYHIGFTVNRH